MLSPVSLARRVLRADASHLALQTAWRVSSGCRQRRWARRSIQDGGSRPCAETRTALGREQRGRACAVDPAPLPPTRGENLMRHVRWRPVSECSYSRERVRNLRGLMPDDPGWNWCNNNRYIVRNKCNMLELSPDFPLPCRFVEKVVFQETSPWCKKVGACCSRAATRASPVFQQRVERSFVS